MSYPYSDIRDFLAALERDGDLRHVRVPVDPTLEVTEIVTGSFGPAGRRWSSTVRPGAPCRWP